MQTADGRRREIATEVVNLQVCSVDGQDFYSLKGTLVVDCLPDVSSNIPFGNEFSCHDHLRDLKFPEVDKKEVGLIIGICSPELHDLCDMRRGRKGEPWAGRSPLGWVVFGGVKQADKLESFSKLETNCNYVSLHSPAEVELEKLLKRQYALDWSENCYTEALAMSKEDSRALEIAKESCTVVHEHYEIRLSWKDNVKLSCNYSLAEQRLRKLGNRLKRDPETHEKYRAKICKLTADGHAVENKSECCHDSSVKYFVPHHCTRPPAKIRVVFDCAARYADSSLNDNLLQGPDLVHSLLGVLHRFRHHKFAFLADISTMFYQVRLHPDDRSAVQFLWWLDGDPDKGVVKYRMCVHALKTGR